MTASDRWLRTNCYHARRCCSHWRPAADSWELSGNKITPTPSNLQLPTKAGRTLQQKPRHFYENSVPIRYNPHNSSSNVKIEGGFHNNDRSPHLRAKLRGAIVVRWPWLLAENRSAVPNNLISTGLTHEQ